MLQVMKDYLAQVDLNDRPAIARFILQHKPDDGPVWVFGYGSLIWNPEMSVAEDLAAVLADYRRELCIEAIVHRGTPDCPGLVLGICRHEGALCEGHAFRLDEGQLDESLHRLIERELVTDCYLPLWVPVDLADGRRVSALTMVVNESHPQYVQPSLDEKERMIRHAVGGRGSSRDYLLNIARHLQSSGIADAEIDALFERLNRPE